MNFKNQNQSIRILFAEYNPSELSEIINQLKTDEIEFTYRMAVTEQDFKKEIQNFAPDIVVSDYYMQFFDGLTALKITKAFHARTPFIFLTSPVNEETAVACLKAGACDYILKTKISRLTLAVTEAIEKQKYLNEYPETEDKRRDSEEIYFKLLENSVNGIFLLKDRKIELINSAFEKMFGYSSMEMYHSDFNFMIMVAPESKQFVDAIIRQILAGEKKTYKFDIKIQTKECDIKEVEVLVLKIDYKGKEIIQGIVRDITTRKQIEEKLTESEKKFRLLFQNHTAVKLIIDPETGDILEANKAAAKFYGWSEDELKNMNISQINLISPDEFRKFNNQDNIFSEFTHSKANGDSVEVEVYSSKAYYDGKEVIHNIIHDISGKKNTEQKLQLLNTAVEQNPLTIVITNPKGEIEYINPAFTEMTGYRFAEVKGRTLSVLNSGLQSGEFYKHLWNTISSGKEWTNEYRNKKKNGDIYWQETIISPILNNKGIITHFVAVMEDISNEKKMIEDLLYAKEKAEESDRLKSAFLANMSHEIRTPMNGIIGFTNLLKEQKLKGEEKKKYINIIKKSSERMLSTLNDLIEISKIESGTMDYEFTELNINEMMDYQKHFFLTEVTKKGLEFYIHKSLPNEIAGIETDYEKLNNILTNLIKNAVKYTSSGRIDIGYRMNKNQIEFYVKDTGIGIEKDRQKIIYDRFVQADMSLSKPYEGAGLGLSIAKGYVDMLGGKIWLESELQRGTQFFFTIPVKNKLIAQNEEPAKIMESNSKDILKNLTVLVAEDDAIGKLYLSELLKGICKKIIFAGDGLEALRLFSETPETDLVLMDIKMPGLNGYQAARKMKEKNNKVIIVAQTAYALSGDKEKALSSGCDAYLPKPFSREQLLNVIEKHFS